MSRFAAFNDWTSEVASAKISLALALLCSGNEVVEGGCHGTSFCMSGAPGCGGNETARIVLGRGKLDHRTGERNVELLRLEQCVDEPPRRLAADLPTPLEQIAFELGLRSA